MRKNVAKIGIARKGAKNQLGDFKICPKKDLEVFSGEDGYYIYSKKLDKFINIGKKNYDYEVNYDTARHIVCPKTERLPNNLEVHEIIESLGNLKFFTEEGYLYKEGELIKVNVHSDYLLIDRIITILE